MSSSDGPERVVRRRLADGSIKEYRYARRQAETVRIEPGSVDALIAAYKRSPEWARLRRASTRLYTIYLRDLDGIGHVPAAAVRRRTLLALRDAIAGTRGHGAANTAMHTWATLFRWGLDRDWLENSPATQIRHLPGGHLLAWTAAEADHAGANLPEPLRRVVVLARYTGQRRGDLVAMTWAAYDGRSIRVTQEKTGAPLVIPAHQTLRAELDAWRAEAAALPVPPMHILIAPAGRKWAPDHLTRMMKEAIQALGMRPGLNVHGLRKLAASSLAEAGCSAHEIASITGHKSLSMVQLYTASAQQERLADAAIIRLEAIGKRNGKRTENS